jgi:hypothetical protein
VAASVAPPAERPAEAVVELPPPDSWEEYLGSLVVQRPSLAWQVMSEHGLRPDELRHPGIRHIVELAAGLAPSVGFPVHQLGASEQRLAARLLVRSLPELQELDDPEPLRRALADCVARVRDAEMQAEMQTVQRELRRARDAGQAAEEEALAARLHQLATERQRIRQAW